ncbi:helix-loop-helix DNA-binding domain-containing protein [Colletotrichum karsti]|uniref:Helix-loop-helix DNA-binding domain-containing protein n=1 Tax=Colletotrichum karsti TaxID=1095194 RepID=A0A9P6I3Z3_9PEZI|nr:helix-loop-helix DNA-binding domain-containing protein [Colletotrichum karsti]KAF9875809.1 helix-loop-helix DNA-binding domain-containing protein [Colletotrichum karsti]
MSSPNKSNSPAAQPGATEAEQPEEKPRLTEAEKKQNHIASEQKRRQAIREGFDRLTELVPGLEGQGRSEGLVLKRTVEFMRDQLAERQALVDRIESTGAEVDEKHKKWVFRYFVKWMALSTDGELQGIATSGKWRVEESMI